jgi:hypothetical protein
LADACFDWARLTVHRRRRDDAVEPEGWSEALAHLPTCAACRRAAVAADPTLVFQLAPPPVAAGAEEAAEVARMRAAVAAMRRTAPLRRAARSRVGGWRAAAAGLLVAVALAQAPRPLERAAAPAVTGGVATAGLELQLPPELRLQPIVEDTDRPEARVYQLSGQGMAVVMIVDETLDV